jgi:hypothetical protein
MTAPSARVIAILLLVLASACGRHATYGRPAPRDTLPTTNPPESIEADPPNTTPGEVPTR